MAKIIGDIGREFTQPNHLFTRHYKDNYHSPLLPPVWIMAELLSFGALSKLLADLKQPADRNRIARDFALDETVFIPLLRHLTSVRNICAHHSRLWNQSLSNKSPIAHKPSLLAESLNPSANHKIYNSLCYCAFLLEGIAPQAGWKAEIKQLLARRPAYARAESMGLPDGWQSKPLWR